MAGVEAVVAYGGIVGRAENRALVKVLRLPVVPLSSVAVGDFDLIAMVDTQPEQGNHSLPAAHFPDVVIDHHPERPETRLAVVADVGRDTGATSTVVTDYLRASGLDPAFYLFRRREKEEVLPWDLVDNGVSKDYFWRELGRSETERLSPHCPEVQGCIRCGVCVEAPNPFYRLPDKWKGRETLPLYERLAVTRPA